MASTDVLTGFELRGLASTCYKQKSMTTPRISVLIDTYNHEHFIEEAIVSVLEQDFPAAETEILVVDDGSTDRTPEIVRRFQPRVRLLRKPNGGQASAFNFGTSVTTGEIVAFLDGDDWWAKAKLTAVVKAFERNPSVAAVGHGFYEVIGTGAPREMLIPGKTCIVGLSGIDAARLAEMSRGLLGTSRLAVRRKILDRIGPIPNELVFCADAPIMTLALALGGAIVLDEPLCYYRQHSRNLFLHGPDDTARLRRRFEILEFLLATLPRQLAELGIAADVVEAFFAKDRVDLERLQLHFGQGGRWKAFGAELRSFQALYKGASPGYGLFKGVVGVCALLLPPRQFEQLRAWYARNNVWRFRSFLGKPDPRVPDEFIQRRSVLGRQS